ncbi:flagellar biosynthesis protein FlhF [Bacillus spongiae]|uniref:Flagellar biosynthesis protein FlhF n=1 Tax=Bacillus spongiae TaxID=2683610 RepID=A0ABU8HAE9_9BACI
MKVTKIIAPTMPEAMKKIRKNLGENAVIINSKVTYSGGFFGMFKKRNIEVIAGLDQDVEKGRLEARRKQEGFEQQTIHFHQEKEELKNGLEIQKDLIELKSMIEHLSKSKMSTPYPQEIQQLNESLVAQGLAEEHLYELIDYLLEKDSTKRLGNEQQVKQWTKEWLVEQLKPYQYGGIDYNKKYVNVVGPTGVGKTTTLAKIAAQSVLTYNKKVAFITTDTYRIAAIEQLKTYAELLKAPIEVVYNRSDFQLAIDKFKEVDTIFIDTAGRNYHEIHFVEDLPNIIDFSNEMETLLVLSLTAKETDLVKMIDNFAKIHFQKFIFTKIDETSSYGTAFNLIKKYKKGAAYLTNGQDVPEDILEASEKNIAELILRGTL